MCNRRTRGISYFGLVVTLALTSVVSGCGGKSAPSPIAPPDGLAYENNPANYNMGTAITPNKASCNNGRAAVTYSVSPALPDGLSLNPSTGEISGTPSAITPVAIYTVTATNSLGSSSVGLSLIVRPPMPTISIQPSDQAVEVGQSATFSVTATGTGELTYQWMRNGSPIQGANSTTYTTSSTSQADDGSAFNVVVSDFHGGSVNSTSCALWVRTWTRFVATGSMLVRRLGHTATLLPSGKVLLVGGSDQSTYHDVAEVYDPATGIFSATGKMSTPRARHTATLLPNGKVLIVGGVNSSQDPPADAEVYDPVTGNFSAAGKMGAPRAGHTATLLSNGKVLIAGGLSSQTPLAVAELYDPVQGSFKATGRMGMPLLGHTATLLDDGRVLLIGYGSTSNNGWLAEAELYDPVSELFASTGSMKTQRRYHQAVRLASGKVLVVGGHRGSAAIDTVASAELYDPLTGAFTVTGDLVRGRVFPSAIALPNSKVLIVGGYDGTAVDAAELYDPTLGTFSSVGKMVERLVSPSTVLLPNGKVLVVECTAELFE